MKCKECEFFKITSQPMMPYDSGHALCKKYNLVCDFNSQRKINRLICVKESDPELAKDGE